MNEADAGQSPTGSKDGILHALRGWAKLIALISFILCLLIAFTPRYSIEYIPESFDSVGGFGWVAPAPIYGDDVIHPKRSNLRVYESGEKLEFPHQTHSLIKRYGKGRYSHWTNLVYFSSLDNSDPNTNGRSYVFMYKIDPLPNYLLKYALAALGLSLIIFFACGLNRIRLVALLISGVLTGILAQQIGWRSSTDIYTSDYRQLDSIHDKSKSAEDMRRFRQDEIHLSPGESDVSFLHRVSSFVHEGTYHCGAASFRLSPLAKASLWLRDGPADLFDKWGLLIQDRFLCGFCHQRAYLASTILNKNGFSAVPYALNGHVVVRVKSKSGEYIIDPDFNTQFIKLEDGKIPMSSVSEAYNPLTLGPELAKSITEYYATTEDNSDFGMATLESIEKIERGVLRDASYYRWVGFLTLPFALALLFETIIREILRLGARRTPIKRGPDAAARFSASDESRNSFV